MTPTTGSSLDPNPYRPPASSDRAAEPRRGMFVLAAVGAGLASVYWAALALLLGVGAAAGSLSGVQVILPGVLIVLYAVRAYQIFKGDAAAARRILWLHGLGALVAVLRMSSDNSLIIVLNVVKIAIHIFGGVTAYLAQRGPRDGA